MLKKDLISINDLRVEEIEHIFSLTAELKGHRSLADFKGKNYAQSLSGKSLGLIFLKPSLRTRASFEVGMTQLGGHTLYLAPEDIKFGTREATKDFGAVLSRYLDALVVRTFAHKQLEELAEFSGIPVINGLTDLLHPCQALSDLYTIQEKKGSLKGINLAYFGDGNNVAHSLLYGCAKLGLNLTVATPVKHKPKQLVLAQAEKQAKASGAKLILTQKPAQAAAAADIIYTDVWASMGQESKHKQKRKDFLGFQVNQKLLAQAKSDCLVMHCLPAHRGEEITSQVIDGPNSVVLDQAENRMHVQKAILLLLLEGRN
ncbi:MAG: ornithine carbamoyltransferase [Candidatus Omnitrophica bacterium]|nr:ornithine carbamoyltransferase [Candidatus Omnitrophota bacterium]